MMRSERIAPPGIRGLGLFCLAVVSVLGAPMSSRAELPPLIPRDILFGNPEKVNPQISPDGARLAWIAPDKKNVLQVWVKTIGKDDDKTVTADPKRGIRQFFWAENSKMLIYLQDSDGDENFHLFGVDLASGNVRDLTPFQGVKAQTTAVDPNFPDTILVALNLRNRALFDVYRLDLNSGALVLDTVNPGDVMGWVADPQLQVRAAQATTPEGGVVIRIRDDSSSAFRPWLEAGPEDALTLQALDFSADGKSLYLISALGRDTAAVVKKDLAGGGETELAASADADADERVDSSQDPCRPGGQVLARAVDLEGARSFDHRRISTGLPSSMRATSRWSTATMPTRPGWWRSRPIEGLIAYYAWDRGAGKGTFLFVHQPKLEGLKLAEMKPIAIKARDGLTLHGYLTLPVGAEPRRFANGPDGPRRTLGQGSLGI